MSYIIWLFLGVIIILFGKNIINYILNIHDKYLENRGDIEG